MATPWSITVVHAGLSSAFDKALYKVGPSNLLNNMVKVFANKGDKIRRQNLRWGSP